ncbi:MAG: TauD/TfdA family dioxygenase, partial [Alphaproteobacteria bacterium]|nr:TauD/TfdA family dioxygenase [Alphaproteobacteria bacterium]
GAEISGVDLARLSDDLVAQLRVHWLEHLVLVFHGQDLSPVQFLDVARRFGEPMDYPFLKGLDGTPRVTVVSKLEHETINFGGMWHSDTTYLPEPPSATLLIAREVPPHGGDTLFANQYAAFDALSAGMKRVLDTLDGISSSAKADASRTREDRIREGGRNDRPEEFHSIHPAVRTHPETGRKALYINPAHTVRFNGMTEEESAPLLAFLHQHQVKPEFTCRVSWRAGTLALWDNRCVLHNPVNDYQGFRRVMHRVTLKGDTPRR